MMEVDWSAGEIMKVLRKHDLHKNTLFIFTSDNGPWLNYGDHAGSAVPLREGKGTMFEGGCLFDCSSVLQASRPSVRDVCLWI